MIERMVQQAREYIMRRTGTFYNLFNPPPAATIDDFVGELSNSLISVDGPEMVFGKLFYYVGYEVIGGLFRPLVLSRLVAFGSKLDMWIIFGDTAVPRMTKNREQRFRRLLAVCVIFLLFHLLTKSRINAYR